MDAMKQQLTRYKENHQLAESLKDLLKNFEKFKTQLNVNNETAKIMEDFYKKAMEEYKKSQEYLQLKGEKEGLETRLTQLQTLLRTSEDRAQTKTDEAATLRTKLDEKSIH